MWQCDQGSKYLILFNFNQFKGNSHMWLVAAIIIVLYSVIQHSSASHLCDTLSAYILLGLKTKSSSKGSTHENMKINWIYLMLKVIFSIDFLVLSACLSICLCTINVADWTAKKDVFILSLTKMNVSLFRTEKIAL